MSIKVILNQPIWLDTKSRFYKNCKRRRKDGAKICQDCPFRWIIEDIDGLDSNTDEVVIAKKLSPDRLANDQGL